MPPAYFTVPDSAPGSSAELFYGYEEPMRTRHTQVGKYIVDDEMPMTPAQTKEAIDIGGWKSLAHPAQSELFWVVVAAIVFVVLNGRARR